MGNGRNAEPARSSMICRCNSARASMPAAGGTGRAPNTRRAARCRPGAARRAVDFGMKSRRIGQAVVGCPTQMPPSEPASRPASSAEQVGDASATAGRIRQGSRPPRAGCHQGRHDDTGTGAAVDSRMISSVDSSIRSSVAAALRSGRPDIWAGGPADLDERLPHRGERRGYPAGDRQVVEADDRKVRGTRSTRWRAALNKLNACWSLPAKIAVGGRQVEQLTAASKPASRRKSPLGPAPGRT